LAQVSARACHPGRRTALIAWVLAQGIVGNPFASLNEWLYDHAYFYRGYREPGKFIGLIALALAYGYGLGVAWIVDMIRPGWVPVVGPLAVAWPLLYTPTMVWGAAGQLKAVDYPRDWYSLNRRLNAEKDRGAVLFLPWHQYMSFNFAGRLIANPASRFFDRHIIQGDNAQIGLIEHQTSSPLSQKIEKDVLADDRQDVARRLKALGITHVVLAKEADYNQYAWLDDQPGLSLTAEGPTLKLYEVTP
jgi:hypothetical protein